MKKHHSRRLLVMLLALVGAATLARALAAPHYSRPLPSMETGDLVFQMTRGRLALVSHAATHSKFTHVGLVVMRKGKPWVLEANGRVAMNRLARFVRRGVGRRMYCSELVWKAYRRGPHMTLASPETIGDLYSPYNPAVRAFARRLYGKRLPLKELIVTPKRLLDSDKLETVYDDTWF